MQDNLDKRRKKNKMIKQKSKQLRKKVNKKTKKTNDDVETAHKIPNLKEVPLSCQHLVNNGNLVYVVPGDGACGPNCGAAFLKNDIQHKVS